jgi:hypothetical protein
MHVCVCVCARARARACVVVIGTFLTFCKFLEHLFVKLLDTVLTKNCHLSPPIYTDLTNRYHREPPHLHCDLHCSSAHVLVLKDLEHLCIHDIYLNISHACTVRACGRAKEKKPARHGKFCLRRPSIYEHAHLCRNPVHAAIDLEAFLADVCTAGSVAQQTCSPADSDHLPGPALPPS